MALGLVAFAAFLALTTLWEPDTSALALAGWFFGATLAIAWVMAPATDVVVGAAPVATSGVASATNTVAHVVSGALGVAILGSLVSSIYANEVANSLGNLPRRAQATAEDSVGAANAIATHPTPARNVVQPARHDGRRLHARHGARPTGRRGARRRRRAAGRPLAPEARTRAALSVAERKRNVVLVDQAREPSADVGDSPA